MSTFVIWCARCLFRQHILDGWPPYQGVLSLHSWPSSLALVPGTTIVAYSGSGRYTLVHSI